MDSVSALQRTLTSIKIDYWFGISARTINPNRINKANYLMEKDVETEKPFVTVLL